MSELRELWQRVEECDRGISQSLYAVVERLVEIVLVMEVGKHMASLAYVHTQLAEANAEWGRLAKERDEAQAEIERLRESCRWWKQRCENTICLLAEAQRN